MKNLSMYCLTLEPEHEEKIKALTYIPVGLGDKKFSNTTISDKDGENISKKNPYYGEYTFHYWLWKNYLNKIETEWVGFCQYRKFFIEESSNINLSDFNLLNDKVVKDIPNDLNNFDCIMGKQFSVANFKFIKFFKKNPKKIMLSPLVIFQKKKRNIKFHFDIFHGDGNLELAINLLDKDNKSDFTHFVKSKTSFNQHNMFICKKKLLKNYYDSVFPWLQRCESIFGFSNLKNYGMKRIYGFLAERYLSYWFTKNVRVKEYPIIFKDLSDYKNF